MDPKLAPAAVKNGEKGLLRLSGETADKTAEKYEEKLLLRIILLLCITIFASVCVLVYTAVYVPAPVVQPKGDPFPHQQVCILSPEILERIGTQAEKEPAVVAPIVAEENNTSSIIPMPPVDVDAVRTELNAITHKLQDIEDEAGSPTSMHDLQNSFRTVTAQIRSFFINSYDGTVSLVNSVGKLDSCGKMAAVKFIQASIDAALSLGKQRCHARADDLQKVLPNDNLPGSLHEPLGEVLGRLSRLGCIQSKVSDVEYAHLLQVMEPIIPRLASACPLPIGEAVSAALREFLNTTIQKSGNQQAQAYRLLLGELLGLSAWEFYSDVSKIHNIKFTSPLSTSSPVKYSSFYHSFIYPEDVPKVGDAEVMLVGPSCNGCSCVREPACKVLVLRAP